MYLITDTKGTTYSTTNDLETAQIVLKRLQEEDIAWKEWAHHKKTFYVIREAETGEVVKSTKK